jgi:hypothetical protein
MVSEKKVGLIIPVKFFSLVLHVKEYVCNNNPCMHTDTNYSV